MKSILLIFICIIFSVNAFSSPGSWTPQFQKISTIIIEEGTALIMLEGGVHPAYIPEECDSSYNQADLSTEHGKAIYSMALTAQASGRKVKIALHCLGSRPRITHMRLDQ